MAVTISITTANTYFGEETHIQYAVWDSFSTAQRTGAIANALRVLNRYIDTDIEDDETIDAGDYYQPDYAVYEQALYMLVNSDAIPNGDQTGAKFLAINRDADKEEGMGLIAPESMNWLGIDQNRVEVLRG